MGENSVVGVSVGWIKDKCKKAQASRLCHGAILPKPPPHHVTAKPDNS